MPMLIRYPIKSAVWLVFALVSAACAVTVNPAEESNRPAGSTSGDQTGEVRQPAGTSPTATEETAVQEELAALAKTPTSPALALPDLGPAPDITNEVWLNTDQPLNLAALRGRVVLVEFWTFG